MSSDLTGVAYDFINFIPQTKFVDANTFGHENVENETDIKILHLSAPSTDLLSQKIKTLSKTPSTLPKTTDEAEDKYRHAVLYSTVENLSDVLATSPTTFKSTDASPPKICFLITCQGAQYARMGQQVYEWSPIFRRYFDECNSIIKEDYKIDVKNVMYSDDETWISDTLLSIPYILSLEYALFKLWDSWGIKPDVILGLSFGDYGAAALSGIVSLRDTIKLVMSRTQLLIDNIEPQSFAAVEMDVNGMQKMLELLRKEPGMEDAWLDITCVNSPLQTCVAGYKKYIKKFVDICKENGARCMTVDSYHPYHSRLCAPVIPQFEEITSKVKYNKTSCGKFISTVRKGLVMETLDKDYYLQHLQGAALFADAIATVLKHEGITHFLEIGPHPINIQMVKDILQNTFPELGMNFEFYPSLIRKKGNRLTLLDSLGRLYTAGFNVNWENVNKLMDN